MLTFGDLKLSLRGIIFPQSEASNLVAAHDKCFIDAIIDIQTWVECSQQDNTSIIPQCATFYNCGLTTFDAPRGAIKKISVVDQINATTGREDITAPVDWCSEIPYNQVDACHVKAYLSRSKCRGCCPPILPFFGLWPAPVPTGVGVPPGLAPLPLGYSYPQTSTDRSWGRAGAGIWALERGQIFLAPWIQSTESVMVVWDGIKRTWADADPVDDDPLFSLAIEEYVRWKHAGIWDKDPEESARARDAYDGPQGALTKLIHQCREETRVRDCEPSHARGANNLTSLFYNDDQSASAQCPDGTTGASSSVTVSAGTVASSISKADANSKAQTQAQTQAQAQLVCVPIVQTFKNNPQTAVATCAQTDGEPPPDGTPVTVTVPAGVFTSTLSQADADAQALASAQTKASAGLSCTWWNAAQTYTATCPNGTTGTPVTVNIAAHTYSSTVSQADADTLALNAAKAQAESQITCTNTTIFFNTQQVSLGVSSCLHRNPDGSFSPCQAVVTVTVLPARFTSLISQADANGQALSYAAGLAQNAAGLRCKAGLCGPFSITY